MATEAVPITGKAFGLLRYRDGRFFEEDFESFSDASAASTEDDLQAALAAAGGWSDLDYDAAVEALERSRHEMPPSPPLGEA